MFLMTMRVVDCSLLIDLLWFDLGAIAISLQTLAAFCDTGSNRDLEYVISIIVGHGPEIFIPTSTDQECCIMYLLRRRTTVLGNGTVRTEDSRPGLAVRHDCLECTPIRCMLVKKS